MSRHMLRDIESLEQRLLLMSSMVEEMVDKACRGLQARQLELVADVIEQERQIDVQEVMIEEECLKILALHQPVAGDLRRVATMLKVNNDLERMADLAVNVSERAVALAECPEFVVPPSMERLAAASRELVGRAMDSFVRADVAAARRVMAADDTVDELNRVVIGELIELMGRDSQQISAAVHCFSASRHIERIADHATNIAEDVVYLVEGEIARHRHEVESETSSQ